MDISNALTPVRGDARYVKKLFSAQDMFDNTTNYVVLGLPIRMSASPLST